MNTEPLSPEVFHKIDAYWRAANYLSVGQIYLYENPGGISQPRVNDLLRGRVSRFSLDALVNIAAALGRHVHIELEAA
jgi:phosphoketolase